jgi:hypothetical protein
MPLRCGGSGFTDGRVLEMGCGDGRLAVAIASDGRRSLSLAHGFRIGVEGEDGTRLRGARAASCSTCR